MTQLDLTHRTDLPEDLRFLLGDYPRDGWVAHPHFARSIQNWLGAHHSFRQLGDVLASKTQRYLNRDTEADTYINGLAYYGDLLIRNLHGHHTWEDSSYFPELAAADHRFKRGQDLLESDHVELDALLDRITTRSNRAIQLQTLDPKQVYETAAPLEHDFETLKKFLNRHLSDEEDLVVPILLHHKMRA